MSAQSPELQSKILIWRQKAIEGTLTEEEVTQAITALRGDRVSSAAAATTAKKSAAAKKVIPSAADLLSELGMEEDEEEGDKND